MPSKGMRSSISHKLLCIMTVYKLKAWNKQFKESTDIPQTALCIHRLLNWAFPVFSVFQFALSKLCELFTELRKSNLPFSRDLPEICTVSLIYAFVLIILRNFKYIPVPYITMQGARLDSNKWKQSACYLIVNPAKFCPEHGRVLA